MWFWVTRSSERDSYIISSFPYGGGEGAGWCECVNGGIGGSTVGEEVSGGRGGGLEGYVVIVRSRSSSRE